MLTKPAVLICIFFTLFYAGTSRVGSSTDAVIASLLPVSIIRGNGFDLEKVYPTANKILPTKVNTNDLPYYVIEKNGHLISAFPIFSSLISTPIYFVPVVTKNVTLDNLENHINLVLVLAKLSASFFSALSVAFVYLAAKELTKRKTALLLTILYALGTSTLSISSQALWQHAASQMFLASAMYIFVKGQKNKKLLPLSGLLLGFATLCRYPNALIAFAFFIYVLLYEKKTALRFVIYAIPSILFFAWYQIKYPGNIFFYKYEALGEIALFNNSFTTGFFGLLIAPNKGLLIYSPFFIFSIAGMVISFLKKQKLMIFFSAIVILYLSFIARWSAWHGGWSFGPRMLADITPFLIILIVPFLKTPKAFKHPFIKYTFILTAFIAIYIHFLGSTAANFSWYFFQTKSLSLEQAHKARFLWDWNYPEIYYFYLQVGGFIGSIKIFTIELAHITSFIIKGLAIIAIPYLLINIAENRLRSKKLSSKR